MKYSSLSVDCIANKWYMEQTENLIVHVYIL